MTWEKRIAKEWLYLLGFAVLSVFIFYGMKSIKPYRVNPPTVSIPVFEAMNHNLIKSMYSDNREIRDSIAFLLDSYVTGVSKELIAQGYSSGKSVFQDLFDFQILKYFSNDEKKIYDSLISSEETIDKIRNRYGLEISDEQKTKYQTRDSLRLLALERWYNQYDKYQTYRKRLRIANSIPIFIYFLPYPIFLFLRTIFWAIRQVRKKPDPS